MLSQRRNSLRPNTPGPIERRQAGGLLLLPSKENIRHV